MRAVMVRSVLVAGLAGVTPAWASQALAQSQGCLACHDTTKKTVGPSVKNLAARYKGQANVVDAIAARLKAGKGHPPVETSEAELKAILGWMLK